MKNMCNNLEIVSKKKELEERLGSSINDLFNNSNIAGSSSDEGMGSEVEMMIRHLVDVLLNFEERIVGEEQRGNSERSISYLSEHKRKILDRLAERNIDRERLGEPLRLKREIMGLNNEKEQKNSLDSQLDAKGQELEKTKNDLKNVQNTLNQSLEEIKTSGEGFRRLKNEKEELEEAGKRLVSAFWEKDKEFITLQGELNSLESQLYDKEQNLRQVQNDRDNYRNKWDASQDELEQKLEVIRQSNRNEEETKKILGILAFGEEISELRNFLNGKERIKVKSTVIFTDQLDQFEEKKVEWDGEQDSKELRSFLNKIEIPPKK